MSMPLVAVSLSLALDRPVADETGLAGDYELALTYAPETGPGPAVAGRPLDDRPSIFTAVQEQLGLKLEPRRTPADFLIVDRIERPTGN
jgi:uncharacterized protein (TIGR03435 family)